MLWRNSSACFHSCLAFGDVSYFCDFSASGESVRINRGGGGEGGVLNVLPGAASFLILLLLFKKV